MRKLAPVLLFVYNRLYHTRQTVEALQKNFLASDSELFVYSDGGNSTQDKTKVQEVRDYVRNIKGFKEIKIIERENNWGLASSIVDGVTKTINKYGKVIVLEDDLVTSPFFLKFMNDSLTFYENKKKVWHVSGWNYPISGGDESDVFLWRVMNCWGWATWSDRWSFFDKDTGRLINSFTSEDKKSFNLDGADNFFGQMLANKQGKLDTWAVFWYATIFKNNGLCLNPVRTYVENIGLDGSGENCAKTNLFTTKYNEVSDYEFTSDIQENASFVEKIKEYYLMNKKTKFEVFFDWARKKYLKEQFNPTLLGIFVNPFYFSRKELSTSIIECLPKLTGVILDIGCGSKPYEKLCICDKYIGLELDNPINRARGKADNYYDGKKMPFKTRSMDSVISSQVFEHVFNPDYFLNEINRVLKNDGILLLTVPLAWAEHEQPYDYARYTSFGMEYMLENHGFRVLSLKKTANNFSAIVQIFTSLIYNKISGNNQYFNLLITFLLISPIHIIGLIVSKILPKSHEFYLDNVVLAQKVKDEY
jgi:SAM-dependent methyltransferase